MHVASEFSVVCGCHRIFQQNGTSKYKGFGFTWNHSVMESIFTVKSEQFHLHCITLHLKTIWFMSLKCNTKSIECRLFVPAKVVLSLFYLVCVLNENKIDQSMIVLFFSFLFFGFFCSSQQLFTIEKTKVKFSLEYLRNDSATISSSLSRLSHLIVFSNFHLIL